MNVPKGLVPKDCNVKRSKRKRIKKVKKMEDLVLEPEEFGENNKNWKARQLTEKEFADQYCFPYIQEHDIINRFETYNPYKVWSLCVYIFEYATKDYLQKRLDDIYEETKNRPGEDWRALIIGKYALMLAGEKRCKESMDDLEEVYREKFGAKRLIKKVDMKYELK